MVVLDSTSAPSLRIAPPLMAAFPLRVTPLRVKVPLFWIAPPSLPEPLPPLTVRFEIEASMKPVPDEESTSTSFFVPMNTWRSVRTRVKRARKSAVRWCAP